MIKTAHSECFGMEQAITSTHNKKSYREITLDSFLGSTSTLIFDLFF